jgi:hypothetical protein
MKKGTKRTIIPGVVPCKYPIGLSQEAINAEIQFSLVALQNFVQRGFQFFNE